MRVGALWDASGVDIFWVELTRAWPSFEKLASKPFYQINIAMQHLKKTEFRLLLKFEFIESNKICDYYLLYKRFHVYQNQVLAHISVINVIRPYVLIVYEGVQREGE